MNKRDLQYYKGLNYKIELTFDSEDNCWYARLPELGDVLADGSTSDEALRKVLTLKDEILELDYKRDLPIPEPRPELDYSGRFLLRVPKSLHKKLAQEAEAEGTSINRLAIQILSEDLERRQTMRTVTDSIKTTVRDVITESCNKFPVENVFFAAPYSAGLISFSAIPELPFQGSMIVANQTTPAETDQLSSYKKLLSSWGRLSKVRRSIGKGIPEETHIFQKSDEETA